MTGTMLEIQDFNKGKKKTSEYRAEIHPADPPPKKPYTKAQMYKRIIEFVEGSQRHT